jgi:hypothetical protein
MADPVVITPTEFVDIINNNPTANTSGFLVELMTSINAYVKGEYTAGRITGTEYATVYLGAIQTAVAQAVQYGAQKTASDAQVALLEAKIASEQKTLEVAEQQIALYAAQAKGFEDKSKIDSAKVVADVLSMRMSLSSDVATGTTIAQDFTTINTTLPY